MSKKEDFRDEMRREVREALKTMRKEIEKVRKDLATATKSWRQSTGRFVKDMSPKVQATLDETMEKTALAFRQAMGTIDKQTRGQQVALLRGYKTFLSKQVDAIEKRLKEIAK